VALAAMVRTGMSTARAAKGGNFLSQLIITAIGSAGGQGLMLLAVPFLTRLYTPAQFGTWALFLSACFANTVLCGLRYEVSVVLAKNNQAAMAGLLLTIGVSFCGAVFAEIVILLLRSRLAIWGVPSVILGLLDIIPPLIVATGFFQAGIFWWTREHEFTRIAIARTSQSAITIAAQIILALTFGSNALFLILGTALGQLIAGVAVLGAVVLQNGKIVRHAFSKRRVLAVARRYRRLPLFTSPNTLGAQAFTQGIVVVLASLGGVTASGLYAVSYRSIYNPMALLASSMGQVFLPRMAHGGASKSVESFILRVIRYLAIVLGIGAGLLMAYGDILAPALFGKGWGGAAWVMQIMIWPAIFLVMSSGFERIYDVYNRQHVNFAIEVSFNVLALASLAIMMKHYHNPFSGLAALALIMSIGYIVWLLMAFKIADFDVPSLAMRIGMFLAIAASVWAAATCINFMIGKLAGAIVATTAISLPAFLETRSFTGYLHKWKPKP